jgi:fermentation-respiration switch protein FrsA (DUF1100 family)
MAASQRRPAYSAFIRITLCLLVLLIIAMLSRNALEHFFIYFPSPQHEGTPDQVGLAYEEVAFKATDGTDLTGWLVPATQNSPIVLFCMGNAGNISHRLETLKLLHELGVAVFIFNYRGYGTSAGKANESGLYADVAGAMNLLQAKGWPAHRVIIFGRSLGAAVGLEAALQVPPAGLIMEAAFTSIPAMGRRHYALVNFLLGWLVKAKYDNLDKISKLERPLLVIHGSNDSICPPEMGRQLSKAAVSETAYVEIPGAEHNDAMFIGGQRYREALSEFIQRSTR